MILSPKIKGIINWPLIQAHLCTAAVSLSYHNTWRCPREAFRYGGLQYGIAVTVAMVGVALPLALMQLAVGQLSQQDAVGIWRAVPFFRGVGYLRLLVSLLGSVYTIIYLAVTMAYFLYTLSNSLPFWECIELVLSRDEYVNTVNASTCLKETFMAPVSEKPQYYLAVASVILVLWILIPFVFYNSVKLMKRIFYALVPALIIIAVVVVSFVGSRVNLPSFSDRSSWRSFIEPNIWHGALIQALLSTQIAGGYLITAGDSVYYNNNVEWTAIALVGSNIVATWISLIFWYSISDPNRDTSSFAVLIQVYKLGENPFIDLALPLTMFFVLMLSGFITMLLLLYPIYDWCRRVGGVKWRVLSFSVSLGGAAISLVALAGRQPSLSVLEDIAVPLLISIATILEILALVFIYGWKVLVEDVEFLTGRGLAKFWVLGWCAAPGILAPFTVWWTTMAVIHDVDWSQPPWTAITMISTVSLAFLVFIVLAGVTVAKQVQYDFISKLKSSFKPSRHWGPRDPITHYYWLARRDELERGSLGTSMFQRRELGQMSGRPAVLKVDNAFEETDDATVSTDKKRSNSDDWLYTVYRKNLSRFQEHLCSMRRANSLDWTFPTPKTTSAPGLKNSDLDYSFSLDTSVASKESNNNLILYLVNKLDKKLTE